MGKAKHIETHIYSSFEERNQHRKIPVDKQEAKAEALWWKMLIGYGCFRSDVTHC